VIQYRRLASLLLGAWLGAGILTDIAVTQNFQTVDRFLEAPRSATTSAQLNKIGRAEERVILRRNAGEENNWIFLNWERVELALGGALFILLLFGSRPQKLMLGLCAAMLLIVVAQHFLFAPQIAEIGRRVDDLSPGDPEVHKFWMLHGFYSGLEILKLVAGFAFAVRLSFRKRIAQDHFVREYAASIPDRGVVEMNLSGESSRRG
jgi:hypothetical protein